MVPVIVEVSVFWYSTVQDTTTFPSVTDWNLEQLPDTRSTHFVYKKRFVINPQPNFSLPNVSYGVKHIKAMLPMRKVMRYTGTTAATLVGPRVYKMFMKAYCFNGAAVDFPQVDVSGLNREYWYDA